MSQPFPKSFRLSMLAAACLLSLPAFAENMHHGGAVQPADLYAPVMETMHKEMMIEPTGDADVDFVRGMIPHHRAAVEMAKIELDHGDDPEIQKLAKDIVAAQEKEIAMMQAWLKKHPVQK